jgi:hypothetical protein
MYGAVPLTVILSNMHTKYFADLLVISLSKKYRLTPVTGS